jgi:hypothetical protein
LIEKNDFVEWQWVHGNRYGVLKSVIEEKIESGQDFYADVEILGALKIKEIYGDDAVLVFVLPPSFKELKSRIDTREAETAKEKKLRLERGKSEMTYITKSDCFVLNDNLEKAVEELKKIIDVFKKEEGIDLLEKISIKAKILIKTEKGFLLDKKGKLPEVETQDSKFPHESICEKFYQTEGVGLKVAKAEETKENKGINLFKPFWIDIDIENKKDCEARFYYFASCRNFQENSDYFDFSSEKDIISVLKNETGEAFDLSGVFPKRIF